MSDEPQTKKAKTVEEPAALPVIPRRRIERLGIDVPVLGFPGIALCTDRFADPAEAANLVTSAVERGATYFDVAPLYGDGLAQARLGPALAPHRDKVFLACKTIFRDGEGAEKDLDCSLKACLTTYFDLYQLHSITTKEDVDTALGEGGALEVLKKAKAEGKIKAIGFSAHDEDQALRLIETGEFDTVLFPINFLAWTTGGVGERLVKEATKAGMGILGIKSMARCRITSEDGVEVPQGKMKHMPEDMQKERLKMYANPKYCTWYNPEDEPEWAKKLFAWSLSKGISVAISPGHVDMFEMAMKFVEGQTEVPQFDEADVPVLEKRYAGLDPIFHRRNEAGNKVTYAQ